MFYTSKVLFVHPPRVGGTWLTTWARDHLPGVSSDVHHLKHATLPELVRLIPPLASLESFTVVRDEGERFASWLAHCRGFDLDARPVAWTPEWEAVVVASRTLDPGEFRARHFPPASDYADVSRSFPHERDLASCVAWLREAHGV